ncbi:MAG: hypothetical protein HOW73_36495 [Polyangiaceae bacterium]|nr:hypothetical protein [Polyangiaceae bacterium]
MRLARGLLFVVTVATTAACRQNDDPNGAEALLAEARDDDYRAWLRAPGYEERRPSSAPHSDNVEIFVNDVVEDALADDGLSEWPVGALIVKDGYTDDGTLELTSLMQKREDGWYWAEYDADGNALYSGSPDICVDCHDSGSDFVRAFTLP